MEASDLLRELKRNLGALEAFTEIGKALTGTLQLDSVLELIMVKVGELLAPTHWSLLLLDVNSTDLIFIVARGTAAAHLQGKRLKHGEGLAGQAVVSGESIFVADVRDDPRFSDRFDRDSGFETRSVLAVPLRVRDRCLGAIELVNGAEGRPFNHEDLRTLSAMADYAAIAIDNARNFARIQELTVVDEHTGLYNARHLRAVLAAEVARAVRFRHPISLVFFDLDRFKTVNDTHGHLVGSEVLREIGTVLKEVLRATDVPTRYGGDEFVVVLPETDPAAALQAAGRWRQALSQHPFAAERNLAITASFGVATFPDHAATAELLLAAADSAMYRAKAAGRNAVESAGAPK